MNNPIFDNSIQINIKFTFTVYEYTIVYEYISYNTILYIYTYIYIPTQVFSCEHCKIFKNIYFKGHL